MEKLPKDRAGEIFQDELTENESKPRGPQRDDAERDAKRDPDADSQEGDSAMEQNRFGVNEPKKP